VLRTDASYRNAGPSRYTTNLVEALLAQPTGHDFTLFLNDQVRTLPFTPATPVRVLRTRAPTSRTGIRVLWEHLLAPWHIGSARLDLVHSMLNVVPLAAPTQHVVTVHDLSFMRTPDAHPTHRRWYLTAATWLSARRARSVLADSQATKDDVVDLLGIDPSGVHVVYPGREAAFHPRSQAEVSEFLQGRSVSRPFVLFVGTLEPRKNHALAFEALARLKAEGKPHCLVVAGSKGWLFDDVRKKVELQGLAGDVIFAGRVPDTDLPALYSGACCFLMPSLYEGFGIPVLEAMACGTPVVCSKASSLPEVAGSAAHFIDSMTGEALAEAVSQVVSNPETSEQMRDEGRRQAARFCWRDAAMQTVDVYRSAAGGSLGSQRYSA